MGREILGVGERWVYLGAFECVQKKRFIMVLLFCSNMSQIFFKNELWKKCSKKLFIMIKLFVRTRQSRKNERSDVLKKERFIMMSVRMCSREAVYCDDTFCSNASKVQTNERSNLLQSGLLRC